MRIGRLIVELARTPFRMQTWTSSYSCYWPGWGSGTGRSFWLPFGYEFRIDRLNTT